MSTKVREKKSWKRRLLQTAGLLALLLVALYYALTSTTFVRQFVLPRLGDLLGAEITVGDTVIQPFSRIELRELRVQTGDREPVLEIERVHARYNGWALLKGRLVIEECELIAPRLQVLRVEGGRGNLPLLFERSSARANPPPRRAGASGSPLDAFIRNVSVTNAFVRVVDRDRAGLSTSTTFSNLTVTLDRLANGEPGKLVFGSSVHCERGAVVAGSNDFFVASAEAAFDFETTAALALSRLASRAQFNVTGAGGAFRELAALQGRLDSLLEGNQLSQCELTFEQRGVRVGTARATGTFDPAKSEGQLQLVVDSINRQVLNLVAARYGIEFQQSGVGANVALGITQGGLAVTARGQIVGRQLSVRHGDALTPVLDAQLDFDLRAERLARRLHLQKLDLVARQGTNDLLTGRLDYPMEYSWASNAVSSFTKSTLGLTLTQIDLAAWRALHGRTNVQGQADARLTLTATPGVPGMQLAATVATRDLFTAAWRQARAELTLQAGYSVTNGAGVFAGTFAVRAPGARAGDLIPDGFATDAVFAVARSNEIITVQPSTLRVSRGGVSAGAASLEGSFDPMKRAGELVLKFSGLNEHALGPVLGPLIAPRTLASALLEGDALVRLAGGAPSSLDANLSLSKFALAPNMASTTPVAATLRLSVTSERNVHQLKRLALNFSPGAQPANELEATGLLDLRADKPEPSRLALRSTALDLTTWWDALAVAPAPRAGAPSPAPAPREPAAVRLPVSQFVLDARLDRVIARQLVVSNVVVAARLNDGLLAVKPLEATLNGAPVRGLIDANLGVPGWLYNVDLAIDRVPLRPIAASFTPGADGTVDGELTWRGEFKGAGLTYESLRQKLNGTAQFALTNAAIEFAPGWKQGVLAAVAAVLRTPEIVGGPIAWAGGGVTLGGGQLDLQAVNIGTEAFIAGITGRIPLAEVLTNSPLELPVTLQLRRALADKAKLAVSGPPDAPFAALPDFLRTKGTLGRPGASIDKVVLGGTVLQSLGNLPGLGDEKTRAILQGLGGLLTAPKATTTNAPAAQPTAPASPGAPPRP